MIFTLSAGISHTQVLLFLFISKLHFLCSFSFEVLGADWLNALCTFLFHKASNSVSVQVLMTPFISVFLITRFPIVTVPLLIGWYLCLWRSMPEARGCRIYLYSDITTFLTFSELMSTSVRLEESLDSMLSISKFISITFSV